MKAWSKVEDADEYFRYSPEWIAKICYKCDEYAKGCRRGSCSERSGGPNDITVSCKLDVEDVGMGFSCLNYNTCEECPYYIHRRY